MYDGQKIIQMHNCEPRILNFMGSSQRGSSF